jgi:hypothetical protein
VIGFVIFSLKQKEKELENLTNEKENPTDPKKKQI